eukprot:CAMPEP_0117023718 /NCGR_PEP_ID=MMETSP0472-20121206/17677_1 /TAXON_ID=693140 ORGANISM="Tiarina fusus, Strain LIS" /NCGR_SAMPLE_ID=MMETSP0472 /ASSEMBLY_ACC=CAM_ASM_000603 /LENGTH=477 /DNA_ID=CAMNT_0004729925 /DNA_START=154 /DNA_END=1587 /DNA_ORIENTATION=+
MDPSSLYAPPTLASPKMEQLLAQSLNPHRPGSKSELVSLRSKLWDAQKLTRVILGRESIELKNRDILRAIREVAEMKQELKSLRKQSRKFNRLKARLAKQRALRASDSSGMVLVDEEGEESDFAAVCSCCRKTLDGDDGDAIDGDHSPNHGGEESRNEPSLLKPDGSQGLPELQAKVKAWQERLQRFGQAQETHIQDCKTEVQEMYVTLQAFEDSHTDPIEVADVKNQLDNLAQTMNYMPTKSAIKGLEESVEVYQNEEEKLRRALDTALEENRNLRDENIRFTMSSVPEKAPLEVQKEAAVKKTLASRFISKVRKVYRKDTTKCATAVAQKRTTTDVPKIVDHPQPHEIEVNMTMNTSVETEEEECDGSYEGFEDSVDSLPLDTVSDCSSEIVFENFEDGEFTENSIRSTYTRFYDVNEDQIDPAHWDQILKNESDGSVTRLASRDASIGMTGWETGLESVLGANRIQGSIHRFQF